MEEHPHRRHCVRRRETVRDASPVCCVTTTVDQQTGEASREPLRTLATFRNVPGRGVMFGQNLIHDQSGVLHVGAEVELID